MVKLTELLWGKRRYPLVPNLREGHDDRLYFDGLTRGTLIVGRPGSGKTVSAAMWAQRYALAYPDRSIFVLDASGSFTDEFIKFTYQLPPQIRTGVENRIIYDRMGDPSWVTPMPFFSDHYGIDTEEQIQRVVQNFRNLNDELVSQNPILGGIALGEIAPQLYRILNAIEGHDGHGWQITEAKKLLMNQDWLAFACKRFGVKAPEAKWYFERQFLGDSVSDHERELRSYSLRSALGVIESRAIRARVGYHTPAWTPKEAIEKGLIVLVSGEELTNQESAMGLLFTDVYSHILAAINKRTPHDPLDKPVLLIIDEVPMLLEIKGMADEIGKVSPRYRSRKLQIMVIIQMLAQLDEELRKKIWALGNVACFGIDSHKEAYEIAQQLFNYDPKKIKFAPSSSGSQPVVESDRGGYLIEANWIQNLRQRELILKRYLNEGALEGSVYFIPRTSEMPNRPLPAPLGELKTYLLRRRAIPINEALEAVNRRSLRPHSPSPPSV